MIRECDAVELLTRAEERGIELRLDGGWGVDALLGRQTREHDDIDLFVDRRCEADFAALLTRMGFRPTAASFTTDAHVLWQDEHNRKVDLHLYERCDDGCYLFEGERYPADVFSATGHIQGHAVRCIPPREQVLFHQGYDFDDGDVHDVMLLCRHFGLEIPEEYIQYTKKDIQ